MTGAQFLKQVMKENKINILQFSKKTSITRAHVYRMLGGETITVKTLIRVCKAFNLDMLIGINRRGEVMIPRYYRYKSLGSMKRAESPFGAIRAVQAGDSRGDWPEYPDRPERVS